MKREYVKSLIITLLIGFVIGQVIWNIEQRNTIDHLEQQLTDTQEQLILSSDRLKMIEARNEAIRYIEGVE